MTLSNELLDQLLKGVDHPEDLLGEQGLMKELMARLMERTLGAELTEHLGYEPHGDPASQQGNRRDGAARKLREQIQVVLDGGDPVGVYFEKTAPPLDIGAGNFYFA